MDDYAAVLGPLAAVWLVGVITPGPNFFATMHVAARHGRRAGLATVVGIAVGLSFWAFAGLLGVRALITAVPVAALLIKTAGAAYLVVMGIVMWRNAGEAAAAEPIGAVKAFRFGLLTNLANAKTAAFAVSLFAAALPIDAGPGLFATAFFTIVAILPGEIVKIGDCDRPRGIPFAGVVRHMRPACLARNRDAVLPTIPERVDAPCRRGLRRHWFETCHGSMRPVVKLIDKIDRLSRSPQMIDEPKH